jgi:MFS family permease
MTSTTAGTGGPPISPNDASAPLAGPSRYKWVALFTITLGTLMVFINQSIVLIALPDIFRGIGLNPLTPGNTGYLLWMLLGFMVVLAVLLVTLGRVGDIFGRVRVYNLGFAVFTLFSLLLSITWLDGSAGAWWLIGMRIGQGVGGAMLFANSSAIVTDAFPRHQRGPRARHLQRRGDRRGLHRPRAGWPARSVEWHLVFLISVPFGLFGTVWAYMKLEDRGVRTPAKIDWLGNITFAAGLILILIGITYGLLPYGHHTMGWTSPVVLSELIGGVVILVLFGMIEARVAHPMFRLTLFRIRAFSAGCTASFLAALSRGGLQFMLIIWLQGIWLPEHGYSFSQTPLWAGIYMIPLTVGFLAAGPLSGIMADRFGARPFATGGLLIVALSFVLLQALPVDFSYWSFAGLIFLNSDRHGHVHLAQSDRGHEQPPGQPARRRWRNVGHVQCLVPGPVDRHLLHAHDPGARRHVALGPVPRPRGPRRGVVDCAAGVTSASRREPLRGVPGLQPDPGAPGPRRALPSAASHRALSHQPLLLSPAHLPTVRTRIDRGLLLRGRRVRPGRCSFPAAGWEIPLCRTGLDHPPHR